MWIIITIIVLVIAYVITQFYELIENKNNKEEVSSTEEIKTKTSAEILEIIGLEIADKKDENTYVLDYQGGRFLFYFYAHNEFVDIIYPGFKEIEPEHLNIAIRNCNYVNSRYMIWNAYVEKVEKELTSMVYMVSMSCSCPILGDCGQFRDYLRKNLSLSFFIAKDYAESIGKDITEYSENDTAQLNNAIFQNKVAYLHNLPTVDGVLNDREQGQSTDVPYSIMSIVALFDNADFGCLQELRVVCGNEVKRLTDINEIAKFNLREYICNRPDAKSIENLIVLIVYDHQELVINLTKNKCSTANTLQYVMNVMRSGTELDEAMPNATPFCNRSLLEIRLTDTDKDYWEAKYMVDDANDKKHNNKLSELTDEQKTVLLSDNNPTIQTDLYWGKKFFNNQCYYQSLYYFSRIYQYMTKDLNNLEEKDENYRHLFFEISYYIGFIYFQLQMFDRAYYYLNQNQFCGHINGVCAYIDCMLQLNSPFVKDYITKGIEHASAMLEEYDDEEAEPILQLLSFLNHRKIYLMIEKAEYAEAEKQIQELMDSGVSEEVLTDLIQRLHEKRDTQNPT